MSLLDRHLARQVILDTLLVLLVLTAVASLVTFVGEIGSVGKGHYTVLDAGLYTLLYAPGQAYAVFPVAVLLGAMLGLGDLAAHNELMVMRTAGLSVVRLGLSTIAGGLVLLVLCVMLGEFIAPPAQHYADVHRAELTGYDPDALLGGVWAKDGPLFVNVKQVSARNAARGIYIYRVNAGHRLRSVTQVQTAVFSRGQWRLEGLRETQLTPQGASVRSVPSAEWHTFLSPALLGLLTVNTDSLSARGLYVYVRYLQANGLNADRFIAALWGRVAEPLSLLAMILLALPFVFGPLRSTSTGQRLVTGMLIGIGFYVFNSIFVEIGVVFGLNPVFTAWFPTLLLAVISGVAVSRIR